MAKFDVYRQKQGGCLVLDCQADLLSDLNTRLVVPLLPIDQAPKPAIRLNPIFDVEGERLMMVTQFAASVPLRELGEIIHSLSPEQDAVSAALDMLFIGF
ncbi:CcdB family protein [Sphingobium sp. SJ10-10]|uniref:CcdB family protein n=1 Tax=Sphingobium sp. SJ10-10 TaxID=3114999 RepID=UPI002E1774C3|nr:CcdB family protein [Sphingobium sp. SJ10-10]